MITPLPERNLEPTEYNFQYACVVCNEGNDDGDNLGSLDDFYETLSDKDFDLFVSKFGDNQEHDEICPECAKTWREK